MNPLGAPQELAKTVRLTVRAAERDRLVAEGRAQMLAAYALRPPVFREIRDRTVHVVPWEIAVAWDVQAALGPAARLPGLLRLHLVPRRANVDRLVSPQGPERVLQGRPAAIDGRLPAWDPPRQWVELLCRYRPVARAEAVAGPRPGGQPLRAAARTLRTVEGRLGARPFAVPPAPPRRPC